MALAANLPLTTLFGASAVQTGVDDVTTLEVKLIELDATIVDTAALTPEGIILALLMKLEAAQGVDSTRVLEVTHNQPGIASKGGTAVRYESFSIKLYSSAAISPLEPEDV